MDNAQKTGATSFPIGRYYGALLFIVTLGLIISLYGSYEYVQSRPQLGGSGNTSCSISSFVDCKGALLSSYSSFLGRSTASWGAVFYSGLLLFFLLLKKSDSKKEREITQSQFSVLFLFSSLSFVLSLLLGYISFTEIKALCPVCLALYVVSFLLLVVIWYIGKSQSLFVNLKLGFYYLLIFPKNIVKFLFSDLISNFKPAVVLGLALFLFSLFSDSLFSVLLKRISNYNSPSAVQAWLSEPEVDLKSNYSSGFLSDYRKGSVNPKIKIVEFFDYECPFCRMYSFELNDILVDYGDSVSVEYRNYPIDNRCNSQIPSPYHHNACEAALFNRCAGEQGKFWEAAEYLFTLPEFDQDELSPSAVRNAIWRGAIKLELDQEAFTECMKSDRQMDVIKRDVKVAQTLNIKGTPTVFVNGRQVKKLDELRSIIDYLLK